MALNIARVTDTIDHGGAIITGSPDTVVNDLPMARVTDQVQCNIHGTQTIVTGSGTLYCNSLPVARIGDLVSCGAVIVSGSPDTFN
jgi:uncharacterized Zn-binding protein involved in type VI secretion